MKWLFILFLISNQALADSASTVASTVLLAFGAAKATQFSLEQGIWPNELTDWKDPRINLTAEIIDQCNLLIEGRLLGTNRHNTLALIVKNQGDDVKFKPQNVEFEFEAGVIRRADVDLEEEYTFSKNKRYVLLIPFPRKDDFKDQNKLTVNAQFMASSKACTTKMVFERPQSIAPAIETYTRMTTVEFELNYGRANYSGGLSDFASSNSNQYNLALNTIGPHHGVYIYINGTSNISAPTKIVESISFVASQPEVYLNQIGLGYLNRQIITKKHSMQYKLGVESFAVKFQDKASNNNRKEFSSAGLNAQIQYNYFFAQIDRGFWYGDYAITFSIDDHYVPNGTINDSYNFSGNSIGVLLGLKIGH